jgi:hypothetical protein
VGDRVPVPGQERIRQVLENALPLNRDYRLGRKSLDHRRLAIAHGPPGHDGWKYYFSPWPGEFEMGSGGLRAWADLIEGMVEPDTNFEMVLGIDTTFGGMLAAKARVTVAWLRWAETRVPSRAGAALRAARRHFSHIAQVSQEDLGLIRTGPCFRETRSTEASRGDLLEMLANRPALIYLITDEEKELLGENAPQSSWSPWGWRVPPGREQFEQARVTVAATLRRTACERDAGFGALAQALGSL